MGDEIITLLLQEKLSFLNTVSNSYMLWWVSSIIFCGSVLSSVWIKREELTKISRKYLKIFFSLINVLLCTIIVFGITGIIGLSIIKNEFFSIMSSVQTQIVIKYSEFSLIQIGIGIGTSSFIIALIIWNSIYIDIKKIRSKTKDK